VFKLVAIEEMLVRFHADGGFADSGWLKIAPGVVIITGKNNVGKSRLLRTIGELPVAVNDPLNYPNAPQVRIVTNERATEVDIGIVKRNGYSLSPSRYAVEKKDGRPEFDADWESTPQTGGVSLNYGPSNGQRTRVAVGNIPGTSGVPTLNNLNMLAEQPTVVSMFRRFVYIPPERPFKAQQPTNVIDVPKPDASDLPQAVYTHRGRATEQYERLQGVMVGMFPELEMLLTPPTANNEMALSVRDKFAKMTISLNDAGTGLARLLHIVACVLMYEPGRIFLIDEPTTHLHPGSEKALAAFLREHDEHSYVIGTHSPALISAIRPDHTWLTVRDERGIVVEPALNDPASRRHVFEELGSSPGDVAVAERLLFVEGPTDADVYPIILEKLGWNAAAYNRELIQLDGAGAVDPLQQAINRVEKVLNVRYLIYLDGDKEGKVKGQRIKFLPVADIERLLLRDAAAVFEGLTQIIREEHPEQLERHQAAWSPEIIARFVANREGRSETGKQVLDGLAHAMGIEYKPVIHGPAIANAMDRTYLEDLRSGLQELFT
jgi:ABC-type cobalamin/Fe3+-siderophores transport system ATPase subunit